MPRPSLYRSQNCSKSSARAIFFSSSSVYLSFTSARYIRPLRRFGPVADGRDCGQVLDLVRDVGVDHPCKLYAQHACGDPEVSSGMIRVDVAFQERVDGGVRVVVVDHEQVEAVHLRVPVGIDVLLGGAVIHENDERHALSDGARCPPVP